MKLIIVESYNKIKSIKKFLGDGYEVIASGGHIRELKSIGYGYDKDTLMPVWEVYNKNKKADDEKIIDKVISNSKKADTIYLATDPDREGEAISWHLYDVLDEKEQKKCVRITFNEITKKAILNAMEHPRDIDLNVVYSQWTRRILDRMVGYGLSRLVKNKLNAISAGRVQSVALLFIVERALEVASFVPENWWTIEAKLKGDISVFLREANFEVKTFGAKSLYELKFAQLKDAEDTIKKLTNKYEVYKIDDPLISNSKTLVPFQTDTLLSTSYSKLGWGTAKTNKMAQELYNGIEISGMVTSLISYPRTDTNRLNDDFIKTTKDYILSNYGKEYVSEKAVVATTGPLVQGAHEGIRPIDISVTPKSLEGQINSKFANDLLKLYTLIWTRTVASFMNHPIYKEHIIRFINNGLKFYTSYKKLHFKGYNILPHYQKSNLEANIDLSYLKVGDVIEDSVEKAKVISHQTQPSPLYNEGTLVKELKKSGVGRPSTYSSMVNIVKTRGYVEQTKELTPTPIGIILIEKLVKEFGNIISKKFTANMETDLDLISEGNEDWNKWLHKFKENFDKTMEEAKINMEKIPPRLANKKCPTCSEELIIQVNRRDKSEFIGCSNYKGGCKYTESIDGEERKKPVAKILEEMCPECKEKNLVERYNFKGQPFIGCSGFPKCKYIRSVEREPKKTKEESKK